MMTHLENPDWLVNKHNLELTFLLPIQMDSSLNQRIKSNSPFSNYKNKTLIKNQFSYFTSTPESPGLESFAYIPIPIKTHFMLVTFHEYFISNVKYKNNLFHKEYDCIFDVHRLG